ncbi:MAG: SDR family NAD(P)-dependent oxidoreductase [Ruminococcaceae bacterium]|nr:SDR family NAD(P)-dependent oxidoreductase [Oscillospiraceae bacterium]
MNIQKWIKENTASLSDKCVAITGSTGGIGAELCRYLAELGASLVLMDRNPEKSRSLGEALRRDFPDIEVRYIKTDLEDIECVRDACDALKKIAPDILIHNAGAYSIPRHKCSTGYDNVFQINFLSPYFITKELLPTLREKNGRVIAVGSVAHDYSVTDPDDTDFSSRKKASLVYGNAKRYLMFALHELFKNENDVHLAVTHPGITFTNITAHYPKLIFAVIKHPMKVIFMKPKKACLSILHGVFEDTPYLTWTGPRFFNVWGFPKTKKLTTASSEEISRIFSTAENLYGEIEERGS